MPKNRLVARLLAALVLAGSTVVAVVATPGPAHAAGQTITFLQFNMCGQACGQGLTVAHDVENSINSHNPVPSIVTLEEVCWSQYLDIWESTPLWGKGTTEANSTFYVAKPNGCGAGNDYGIGVLVKSSSFTNLGWWKLPEKVTEAGTEHRVMGCLKTSAFNGSQPVVACVTHITTNSTNIPGQIAFVASKMASFYNGNHVMIGGDFNVKPNNSAMNVMYDTHNVPAGTGIFAEADLPFNGNRALGGAGSSTNEWTSCGGQNIPCDPGLINPLNIPNAKIDYIFLGSGDWTGYSADATLSTHSDHVPLWATATVA